MFDEEELVIHHRRRAFIIGNYILIFFAIIVARLWFLQIYQGKELYQYSLRNRLRKEVVKAPRGMVFSRNNKMLVHNSPRFDVVLTPQYLKNRTQTVKKLSRILDIPTEHIQKTMRKKARQAKYHPIIIKKNVSRQEVAIIETEYSKMPGVTVNTFISREYEDQEIGAHLLGYISEISQNQLPKYRKRDRYQYNLGDFIGQSGLEEELDSMLRGRDGHEFVEVDAMGRKKRHIRSNNLFAGITSKEATPGYNIRLTIDQDLQHEAYKSLEGKVGSAVAVDVATGEILAMVSRPSYNPGQFSRGISNKYWSSLVNNTNLPLTDKTIQSHYAPGSTFKTITALAALEEGLVDRNTKVKCPGFFRLGRRKFHCWKQWGHGEMDVVGAIRESCDVYFYKLATKLNIDTLAHYAKMFGLGERTGISLPREVSGLIPTKEWKKKRTGKEWGVGETLLCAIGQSYVLTTPLQLAMAYAALANGGTLYKPHYVKEIFDNGGEIISRGNKQKMASIPVKKEHLDLVRQGLFEVVNARKGTAWWFRGRGIEMAGKTGTAQVIGMSAEKLFSKCEDNPFEVRNHGAFAAFAPFSKPKIAVSVYVEHGCHGSTAASPVARNIINAYMKKYYPEEVKAYWGQQKVRDQKIIAQEEARKKRLQEEKERRKNEKIKINHQLDGSIRL